MKLLIVTNNPNRASFKQRIEVYIDILQANGIACEVVKLPSGSHLRRKLFKRAKEFDGVFLHKKGLNLIDGFWLRKYSKKIIYNFDDAVMYSAKKPDRNSRSHFIPFRRSVKLADMVIVGNSYLAEHAQRFNSNVKILSIGLKVSDYNLDCLPKDDGKIRLVWIGSKSTLNYLAEMKPAFEEIGVRFDNVILRIICNEFFELENMPVEKQLWSKDTRSIGLVTSDIGLAPLPNDRFTKGKCSFKVLEYASAGLPVVASPIGTNSDHILDNDTGFLVIEMQDWIDRITQLIEDGQLRKKMGQKGRAHAEKFDVSMIGKQLAELITQCLQKPVLSGQ
ncbi:MAG: glycosyltransferase [Planctomycetes bacterium]|nr:glycosyltransferase [Planctomycetota bacterium]